MWDPRSRRVRITRDITWLNRMFFKKIQVDTDLNAQIDWMPRNNPNQLNNNHNEEISDNDEKSGGDDDKTSDRDGEEHNVDPEDNENYIDLEESIYSQRTKSGRITKFPKGYEDNVTVAIDKWDESMLIGAGTGEGIVNTMELHVKNSKEAMKTSDKSKWLEAVEVEHVRMIKNQVWTPVPRIDVQR
jgi:hypothetical protein